MANLRELYEEVLTDYNESVSAPRVVSVQEVRDAINEGLDDLSMYTSFYETSRVVDLPAGRVYHNVAGALGEDVMYITRAQNRLNSFWMDAESQLSMDGRVYSQWESNVGEPCTFIPIDITWFAVHPTREDDGARIRMFCIAIHPHLTSDEAVPDLPPDMHIALRKFALAELCLLDHEMDLYDAFFTEYAFLREKLAERVRGRFARDRVAGVRYAG